MKPRLSLTLRLRSFDLEALAKAGSLLRALGAEKALEVRGPVFLPRGRKLFTVIRSHFVHRKSQDQFQVCTHGRLWKIRLAEEGTAQALIREIRGLEGLSLDWSMKKLAT